jgi:hypothetical protein
MATIRVTGGALEVEAVGAPPYPAHPIVPGPVDPGYGVSGPIDPGYGVPLPPVVSHPIAPGGERPSHQPVPPTYPVDPDYDLPVPPTVWPQPPRPVDPSYGVPVPISPTHPIYLPPVGPDNSLPLPPGAVWPPLPPSVTGEVMCMVWIVGVGYRWTTIDTSLEPTHPIAQPPLYPSHQPVPPPPHPDQGLPGGTAPTPH